MKYNSYIVLAFFQSEKLPDCITEYPFHHERKWRFDFSWPQQRIALEVEGGVWVGGAHNRGVGFVKDIEKYNQAAVLGWRVLRCVPSDLCTVATANLIKEAMKYASVKCSDSQRLHPAPCGNP